MNRINFLCTADWHLDSKEYNVIKAELSLKEIAEYVKDNEINVVCISGDIWERPQVDPFYKSEKGAGVELALKYLRLIASHVDFVFICKGNNSHDPVGSINRLHLLEPNIYAYEKAVVLACNPTLGTAVDLLDKKLVGEFEYIVTLFPYPTKQGLMSESPKSIDNSNYEFLELFEELLKWIGEKVSEYRCPKIFMFHGNVVGSSLTTGQYLTSQDIMVAPKSLELACHDYYALGHIHLKQQIRPHMRYSGSLYNKNWGETDKKGFDVVKYKYHEAKDYAYSNWEYNVEEYLFKSARPMVKLEGHFDIENGIVTDTVMDNPENSEIRYKLNVTETERKLITQEVLKSLIDFFADDGNTTEIQLNVVPDVRESRSEKIMHCYTLLDEVNEYSEVVGVKVTEHIKKRLEEIEQEKEK
jgi:DNA repair exonuclease SbcCD nuclease subunit